MPVLPFLFIVYVLAEIAGFVLVGDAIGVLATLGLVLLSSFAGIILMRIQGFGLLSRIQAESAAGRVPGRELVHGVMILLAGLLLLLPGFLTDILGLLLFIPPIREAAWRRLRNKLTIIRGPGGFGRRAPTTVDLPPEDFQRTDPPRNPGQLPNER